jgi:1-deoxy-D-xylulose-5-phosphate synthase
VVITVEENVLQGGFGSTVLKLYNEHKLLQKIQLLTLGMPDRFIEHGAPHLLLKECKLHPEGIVEQVKDFVHAKFQSNRIQVA